MNKPLAKAVILGSVVTLAGGELAHLWHRIHQEPFDAKEVHTHHEQPRLPEKPSFTMVATGSGVSGKVLTSSGRIFLLPSGPIRLR